ncbi:MAG TPA: 50S ribosomal protein L7 [Ruminococcus sp.]|nr:50S ribosomal protein L7 [Ruminococcus sp.]
MLYQKLTGILSICRKAGKMEMGFATCKELLPTKKVSGVLITSDISPKSSKEVHFFCQKYHVPVCNLPLTIDEIGFTVGRKAAVITVLDAGFFDRINQLCAEQDTAQKPSD